MSSGGRGGCFERPLRGHASSGNSRSAPGWIPVSAPQRIEDRTPRPAPNSRCTRLPWGRWATPPSPSARAAGSDLRYHDLVEGGSQVGRHGPPRGTQEPSQGVSRMASAGGSTADDGYAGDHEPYARGWRSARLGLEGHRPAARRDSCGRAELMIHHACRPRSGDVQPARQTGGHRTVNRSSVCRRGIGGEAAPLPTTTGRGDDRRVAAREHASSAELGAKRSLAPIAAPRAMAGSPAAFGRPPRRAQAYDAQVRRPLQPDWRHRRSCRDGRPDQPE